MILNGSLKARRDGYRVTKRAAELPAETTNLTPEQRALMLAPNAGNDPKQTALATGAIIDASLLLQEYNEESLVSFEAAAGVLGSYSLGTERMLNDNNLKWKLRGALSIIFFRFQAGLELVIRKNIQGWTPEKAEDIRKAHEKSPEILAQEAEEREKELTKTATPPASVVPLKPVKKGFFSFLGLKKKQQEPAKESPNPSKSVFRSIPASLQRTDHPQIERTIVISIVSTGKDSISAYGKKQELTAEEEASMMAYERDIFTILGYDPDSPQPLAHKFISLFLSIGRKAQEYAEFANERYSNIGIMYKITPFRIHVESDDLVLSTDERKSTRVAEFSDLVKIEADVKEMCKAVVDQLNHWFVNLTGMRNPRFDQGTEYAGSETQKETEAAFNLRMLKYSEFHRKYWTALDQHNRTKVDILNPLILPIFYFSQRNVCDLETWDGRENKLSGDQQRFFTGKGYNLESIYPDIIRVGTWIASWEVEYARKLYGLNL